MIQAIIWALAEHSLRSSAARKHFMDDVHPSHSLLQTRSSSKYILYVGVGIVHQVSTRDERAVTSLSNDTWPGISSHLFAPGRPHGWCVGGSNAVQSRALVSKTGLVTSGHYLLFFDRRRALMSARALSLMSARHERSSWALVVTTRRSWALERLWCLSLERSFYPNVITSTDQWSDQWTNQIMPIIKNEECLQITPR